MTAYRVNARTCASCASPMAVHHVAHQGQRIQIDQCEGCGSIFLDYFDGEPGAVARSIEKAGQFRPRVAGSAKNCPECHVPLALTPYLEEGGPEIFRCGECGGAFILPVQLTALADHELPPPALKQHPTVELFETVMDFLKGLKQV